MAKDMKLQDIAAITGVSEVTLRRLAAKGELPGAYRMGHQWIVNRSEFERHRNGDTQELAAEVIGKAAR